MQGRSGKANGPGQVGRNRRYPKGDWLRVEAWRPRPEVGLKQHRNRGGHRMLLEDSQPLVWQDGTREAGKQEGNCLHLRFTIDGSRARVGWATSHSTGVSLGREARG